jgi:hypothetical protein
VCAKQLLNSSRERQISSTLRGKKRIAQQKKVRLRNSIPVISAKKKETTATQVHSLENEFEMRPTTALSAETRNALN